MVRRPGSLVQVHYDAPPAGSKGPMGGGCLWLHRPQNCPSGFQNRQVYRRGGRAGPRVPADRTERGSLPKRGDAHYVPRGI